MHYKIWILPGIPFCFFFFAGCAKNHTAIIHDGRVALKLKQCSDNPAQPVLCFDSLLYDSRCPEDVTCIWSGDAVVELSLKENGNEHHFRLALFGSHIAGYPKDTIIAGFHLTFEDLLPHKKTDGPAYERPIIIVAVR